MSEFIFAIFSGTNRWPARLLTMLAAWLAVGGVPAAAQLPPEFVEQLGPGHRLTGWKVHGNVDKTEPDVLRLESNGIMALDSPLRGPFQLVLEYKMEGSPPPSLAFILRSTFGGSSQSSGLPGTPGEWVTMTMDNQPPHMPGDNYGLRVEYQDQRSAGQFTIDSAAQVEIFVQTPPGVTLALRRVALRHQPPPSAAVGLVVPLVALTIVLVAILGLGWFLNRRSPPRSQPLNGDATS